MSDKIKRTEPKEKEYGPKTGCGSCGSKPCGSPRHGEKIEPCEKPGETEKKRGHGKCS